MLSVSGNEACFKYVYDKTLYLRIMHIAIIIATRPFVGRCHLIVNLDFKWFLSKHALLLFPFCYKHAWQCSAGLDWMRNNS